jgi:hypothetical protein
MTTHHAIFCIANLGTRQWARVSCGGSHLTARRLLV